MNYAPFNAFIVGTELSGDWSLQVTDSSPGEAGRLNRRCLLLPEPTGSADAIFEDGFEQ